MILKAYKQMNEFWECLNSNGCKVFATYRNSKIDLWHRHRKVAENTDRSLPNDTIINNNILIVKAKFVAINKC